jgi:hypothetical protein
MPGKLSVTYELPTRDIHVIDSGPFTTQVKGPWPATATLKPSRRGLTLIVEIETDDPTSASGIADSHAAQLAEHLTLWFCDRVKKAVVAKRTDRQFQGTNPNTLHAFPGEVVFAGHAMKVVIRTILRASTIQYGRRVNSCARPFAPRVHDRPGNCASRYTWARDRAPGPK